MSDEASEITIDGKLYKTADLTETALKLVKNLDHMKLKENEKKNMIAILTKAKKAYISDLKSEMLGAKSGFDFSE